MEEVVSLERKRQSKYSRKISKLKAKVEKGDVKIEENLVRTRKPKHERGVVKVGHIPHGFYEEEMKGYFGQFGKVTNVRVWRSARSGRSRGYAFVEFQDCEVAKVAAETMDNYLMFKRKLIATYIPPEKQLPNMFKGKPWSEKDCPHKRKLQAIAKVRNKDESDEKYAKKTRRTLSKLSKKMQRLQKLGIEHTIVPSDLPDELSAKTAKKMQKKATPKETAPKTKPGKKLGGVKKPKATTVRTKKEELKKFGKALVKNQNAGALVKQYGLKLVSKVK